MSTRTRSLAALVLVLSVGLGACSESDDTIDDGAVTTTPVFDGSPETTLGGDAGALTDQTDATMTDVTTVD